jgi:hypothetical protein
MHIILGNLCELLLYKTAVFLTIHQSSLSSQTVRSSDLVAIVKTIFDSDIVDRQEWILTRIFKMRGICLQVQARDHHLSSVQNHLQQQQRRRGELVQLSQQSRKGGTQKPRNYGGKLSGTRP